MLIRRPGHEGSPRFMARDRFSVAPHCGIRLLNVAKECGWCQDVKRDLISSSLNHPVACDVGKVVRCCSEKLSISIDATACAAPNVSHRV